uniref:Elongin-C n=1 Tax=Strigamia maritima TaxID=126957 RepID=T1J5V4_STRMM
MADSQEVKVYGSCEGPESMYIKLVSSDDHEFFIKRDLAMQSGTIRAMLMGPGDCLENEMNEVKFRDIPSLLLEKVCHYFAFKARYTGSGEELPDFDIAKEMCIEVIMAANFLNC